MGGRNDNLISRVMCVFTLHVAKFVEIRLPWYVFT